MEDKYNNKFKTVGILGGMGPEATASLYLEIVKIFQKKFNAKYDKDFPPFFIYSSPIPDVVENQFNEEILIKLLQEGAKKIESAGANFMVVACNTVQKYLPKILWMRWCALVVFENNQKLLIG